MHILDLPLNDVIRLKAHHKLALDTAGLRTVRHFLLLLPATYVDPSSPDTIDTLQPGTHASVRGIIQSIAVKKMFTQRTPFTEAIIFDGFASIRAIWFTRLAASRFDKGDAVYVTGKVHKNKRGLFFANPVMEKIGKGETALEQIESSAVPLPIYPRIRGIAPYTLADWREQILHSLPQTISDPLPAHLRKKFNLPSFEQALRYVHAPPTLAWASAARKRFAFEELFCIQLTRMREKKIREKEPSFIVVTPQKHISELISRLPFPLTSAQKKASLEILADMERPHPMARLLEGDVGSGKTLVAVIAALAVQHAGFQAAYMAPTEILARQHFAEFCKHLAHFNASMGLLTASECRKFPSKLEPSGSTHVSRSQLALWAKDGVIDILIGTHALIQKNIAFKNLALVIVDEQHRFGIVQRAALTTRGTSAPTPHLLSMTATPIPRTLALTMYGDLNLSLLDEMPPGRVKPLTHIVPPHKHTDAYEFIRKNITAGGQAFVICPRIEETNNAAGEREEEPSAQKKAALEMKSVKKEYTRLSEEVFPDLTVEMLHGKLKPKEKETAIQNFRDKKTDILVSTSVIEVGMDIPNASIMMIEGADRFGLASLHQFRGRVGRAGQQAYCFLFTESKNKKTHDRLTALVKAKNGFELAEYDLALRGAGELSGLAQWGVSDIAMDALKNLKMVEAARLEARKLVEEDSELQNYPDLKERVEQLEKKGLHLE
ncbi:MAG: ATP-dependent DNA helicase RecG [Parcubacteria group bacterium Gr01-1014_29]|nr:MAG: ATP-dependent DNA helicase RecG [Parcubacteria group bacterium Gr01-1014_29]